MANYYITFKNETFETEWDFAVYQEPPSNRGLVPVVWMVCPVSAQRQGKREFTLTYGIALAEKAGNIWKASQNRPAVLGKKYEVKFAFGSNEPYVDPNPIGDSVKDQISVWNNTNTVLDIGVTLSGGLVLVQEGVPGNAMALFNMPSKYYIILYNYTEKGRVVNVRRLSQEVVLGPVELQYTDGYTKAEVSVVLDNGREILKKPKLVV